MDVLEKTATTLDKTEWELFQEICEVSGIGKQRMDALWDGYVQEDFIPEFVNAACFKICMGTTFPEGS